MYQRLKTISYYVCYLNFICDKKNSPNKRLSVVFGSICETQTYSEQFTKSKTWQFWTNEKLFDISVVVIKAINVVSNFVSLLCVNFLTDDWLNGHGHKNN